ncbi:MAG: ATP-binding protein [Bryobacteraceae bacterium]
MTLRTRLLSLTLSMVAVVALTLVGLNLNSLVATWLDVALERSETAGRQVQSFMLRRIEARAAQAQAQGAPGMPAEAKRVWSRIVAEDADLSALLEQTMAQSRSIVEIDVAGEDGIILASSSPARRGAAMIAKQDLHLLREASPVGRITAILSSRDDYESRMLLGIAGQKTPVFTIQILVSPALLRAATLPELRNAGIASGVALALAFFFAYWSASLALRPLARIGHLIDGIVSGKAPEPFPAPREDRELAVIESKLSLLGERFRDAREDASQLRANLEGVLEKLDAKTRRHFEGQIAMARRLTAINSLTGRVAHEIKNPLNSIALRLEMLRSQAAAEGSETGPEIAILSEEVARLDRVVRTFLDFSRPVEMEPRDVDLAEMVAEIVRLLEPEAERGGIRIRYARPSNAVVVNADSGLLRQAALNIAVNAMEAMPGGGSLTFEIVPNPETCTLAITDTGPGIPSEQREKIFQLYYTTKPHGSGIGLAMAFRAMQLHGGTIEVDSEAGHGATFRLILPLTEMDKTA